ncbi:hypothetical protein LCGC14_2713960 [marine sediment metagenome]|uniref:Uncharacterized protein n=1 Tax=marine sediment metagenome TaxID=412755 RepID=A0A0F8ZZP8_9ZZZZ
MKIEVEYTQKKMISRCYHECPHFSLDGGPSPAMFCGHPDIQRLCEETKNAYAGAIISHPDCDNGFPEKCPFLKGPVITKDNCIHNARSRDTNGFFCRDCDEYFPKESAVYRSGELLSTLWMALNNISVDSFRAGKGDIREALEMKDKIGIGVDHDNYEDLIVEAESILVKYGRNISKAYVTIGQGETP